MLVTSKTINVSLILNATGEMAVKSLIASPVWKLITLPTCALMFERGLGKTFSQWLWNYVNGAPANPLSTYSHIDGFASPEHNYMKSVLLKIKLKTQMMNGQCRDIYWSNASTCFPTLHSHIHQQAYTNAKIASNPRWANFNPNSTARFSL